MYDGAEYKISYEIVKSANSAPTILVLHGWGANKELMKNTFCGHLNGVNQIYIDLPGFGASNEPKNPLNSHQYAEVIKAFLDEIKISPQMIMGHSFGGKIAVLLNPPQLILLSSAGILSEKSFKIKAKIAIFKLLKSLGFGSFWRLFASSDANKMNRNMYETLKIVIAEDFSPIFASFSGEALIFWGDKDAATPLKSGQIIAQKIAKNSFYELSGDHFFFLNHAKFIADIITEPK